jgi:iron-sulfur cluster repair protein YtfE (RIC family)
VRGRPTTLGPAAIWGENSVSANTEPVPTGTGAAVDTWVMVLIHRVFRRGFRELPVLIRGVADGDTARAAIVGGHLADLTTMLHHHHTGEDDLLWPLLIQRVSLETELIHRMESQHDRVAGLLRSVDTLLPSWRAAAHAATRDRLAAVIDEVSQALDEHLAEEEQRILPLVSVHLSQVEWDALGHRGQQSMPKGGKGFVLLGGILHEATPEEYQRFVAMLPPPVRLMWALFGKGIYQRATVRLHGAG